MSRLYMHCPRCRLCLWFFAAASLRVAACFRRCPTWVPTGVGILAFTICDFLFVLPKCCWLLLLMAWFLFLTGSCLSILEILLLSFQTSVLLPHLWVVHTLPPKQHLLASTVLVSKTLFWGGREPSPSIFILDMVSSTLGGPVFSLSPGCSGAFQC